jgi:hypothetical protein
MTTVSRFKKSPLQSAILLALGINGAAITMSGGSAMASQFACADPITAGTPNANSANFTMLSAAGYVVGGTNDVLMTWDGKANNASGDYAGPGAPGTIANVTASSTAPFFNHTWTAHDIQVFGPGSYSFDATLSDGRPGQAPETGSLNVTVPSGSLGMHMLFDWNGNNNIDVVVVAAQGAASSPGAIFGTGLLYSTTTNTKGQFKCDANFTGAKTANCLFDGGPYGSAGQPTKDQVWTMASSDPDGDAVMGVPMAAGGPFAGFNANFNMLATVTGRQGDSATGCQLSGTDTDPDPFNFPAVEDAPFNQLIESAPVTVSDLTDGVTVAISVTGGQYAVSTDGGSTYSSFTNPPPQVKNQDRVKVRGMSGSANDQTTNVVLTIGGRPGTFTIATPVTPKPSASNFTMVDSAGGIVGGTNDVLFTQTGPLNTNVATAVVNGTLKSCQPFPFFGFTWTAYDVKLYGPGTYTIPTADTPGPTTSCRFGKAICARGQDYGPITVGPGQIMAHMKFAWNTTEGIDVINIWEAGKVFGPSKLYLGPAGEGDPTKVWDYMSIDVVPDGAVSGDGRNGLPMIDGPFTGFNANFNIDLSATKCPAPPPPVVVQQDVAGSAAAENKSCSLSTSPVAASRRADWWIVGGFVTLLGALRLRRSVRRDV